MSQIKKVAIENKILKSAKTIFLKYGFLKASLREIAKRANISLSNLYNYYPDKNALFVAVLQPELADLEKLCHYGRTHRSEEGPFDPLEKKQEQFLFALNYIYKHRRELNLLLNHSTGSSLEKYPEYLAQEYEQNWDRYFEFLPEKFPNNKFRKPSSFFLKNMAHFHLTTISKFLSNDYTLDEMIKSTEEIATFIWHGGVGLIHLETK